MRRRLLTYLLPCMLLLATPLSAATKGWEPVKTEQTGAVSIIKEAEIEIKTVRGAILITVTQPTHVRVFSILGQQVSNATLQPGTHRLPLTAHGVYIIKTGDLTCKVVI